MAKPDNSIPIEYLREALVYDPATGALTWRHRPLKHFATHRAFSVWNAQWADKRAARVSRNAQGYSVVALTFCGKRRQLKIHRVAFALMTGRWPDEVDHRDGVRSNNRWPNLREATDAEQYQNIALHKDNASGFRGVSWRPRQRRWAAYLGVNGRNIRLGDFRSPESAFRAYLIAKAEYHPFQPEPRDMGEQEAAVAAGLWFAKEAAAIAARRENRSQ